MRGTHFAILVVAPVCGAFQVAPRSGLEQAKASTTALAAKFDPSTQLGAQPPTGFWDPWGLSDGISEEQFVRWRTVEQKHGRIAMAAVIGYCVPEFIGTFGDTYLSTSENVKFSDLPKGAAALFKIPTLGVLQILLFIGILETQFESVNGDYGTGYFGNKLTEPLKSQKLAVELSNGRLAMLAIVGLFAQDCVTGGTPFEIQASVNSYVSL